MQKVYFNISLLLFILFCGCESMEIVDPVQKQNFFKLYGSYYNDYMLSVKQCKDLSLLISGYMSITEEESTAYLCKSTPYGIVEWDTTFNENINSKAHDMAILSDSSSFYMVMSEYAGFDTIKLTLFEMDFSGATLSIDSTLVSGSYANSIRIAILENEQVRLYTQVEFTNIEDEVIKSAVVVHDLVDSIGLVQKVVYDFKQSIVDPIRIAHGNDNVIYLAATIREDQSSNEFTDIRVFAVASNGVSWDNNYGIRGISESCSDIIFNDNQLSITGNYKDSERQKIYLLHLDLFGARLGSDTISVYDRTSDISVNSFVLNDSNNFVFTGSIKTGIGTSDILFMETRKTGENIRYKTYGSNGEQAGESKGLSVLFLKEFNNYLLAAELEVINNKDISIMRVDRQGNWITGK